MLIVNRLCHIARRVAMRHGLIRAGPLYHQKRTKIAQDERNQRRRPTPPYVWAVFACLDERAGGDKSRRVQHAGITGAVVTPWNVTVNVSVDPKMAPVDVS